MRLDEEETFEEQAGSDGVRPNIARQPARSACWGWEELGSLSEMVRQNSLSYWNGLQGGKSAFAIAGKGAGRAELKTGLELGAPNFCADVGGSFLFEVWEG